jgi:peroxiredoxin
MALLKTPLCAFGWPAPDFALPDPDGKVFRRDSVRGENGLLVVFMCNHCPYVRAIADRLVSDAKALQCAGVGVVAIMANDVNDYAEDRPEKMKAYAQEWGLTFPYLYDQSQDVARAYGAVCTPDFFGFDTGLRLQYRGRIDNAPMNPAEAIERELLNAMLNVAETGKGPEQQTPSMGCSIKWR